MAELLTRESSVRTRELPARSHGLDPWDDPLDALIEEARRWHRRQRRRRAMIVLAVAVGLGLALLLSHGAPGMLGNRDAGSLTPNASAVQPGTGNAHLPNPCSLLTDSQVASALSGRVVTRTLSGNRLSLMCDWAGAPMGFMQDQTKLYLQVFRISESRFIKGARGTPVPGLGAAAFTSQAGLIVWKDGYEIGFFGQYFSVYPAKGIALARAALDRLR